MEEYNFRILHVPTEDLTSSEELEVYSQRHMSRLKGDIIATGFIEVMVNISKVKKSEDEDNPGIEELIFQVRAKDWNFSKYERYQMLLRLWKDYQSFPPSIVIFHEKSSFLRTRRTCHLDISCRSVLFGVLAHDGQFQQYASLSVQSLDFFHDTRSMKIACIDKELRLSYNHIRNIFVNIGSSPREIFFDLSNPPLVYKLIHRHNRYGSYTVKNLTVTLPFEVDVFGKSNVIRIAISDEKVAEEIISMIHFKNAEKPVHYTQIFTISSIIPFGFSVLPSFGCTYLLTAIFKRNFTMAAQTSDISKSVSELAALCLESESSLEKALTLVLAAVDSGKVVNFWHAIKSQYRYYLENKDEVNYKHYVVPEKCRMIRRVTLTPSRQLLWAPEIMFGNRVLRKYDSDYALRVSFRDDNMSRLSFNAAFAEEDIFEQAISLPMSKGIHVGLRHYEFLAWSNSQIRDHGVWMYARDEQGNSAGHIRSWMGDFSHIHSVPKYMSRMGQCFSQTEDAVSVPLDESHVRTEKDIEAGFDPINFKPYCFSDGIGKISVKLANEVHKVLDHDKLCSAFQIRYGGYKGMLVIDPSLQTPDIVFRDSMKKFNSPQNTRLEIAKTSSPISLQLNRPFITILNDMGVRHRTFLKLQEEMLKTLTDVLFDEKRAAAFLESKTPNQLFKYKDLSDSGIYLTTEPFFKALLLALHRHHVEKIKTKANIAIDPSHGRNMLGVLDETGLLNEGEVFVQYTKDLSFGETTRDTVVLERTVLVTKNPCLLPGDVRKFQAVNVPHLHHIVDCIVFPQKGSRPHPDEMAGSDLDGDEYAVVWHDDLIFHQDNKPPGDFPRAPESYKEHITENDMINFLVTYIKNDQLGSIATAHLAHADASNIFSYQCINIAKKFSFAVDYAKTGVSRELAKEERPPKYPDFMEKNHKKTYKSKKALGKMFRVASDYESENKHASLSYQNIQVDEDLRYPGWEKYKKDAIKSRNKYTTLLKTILRTYGVQHEAEIFSGAFTKLHCRFQERKDREEIEKVVLRCIKQLNNCLGEEFHEEFKKLSNVKDMDVHLLQKASAWYIVTYSDKNAKSLSFPWTVSKYLALIKIKQVGIHPLYISPIVKKMDQQIKVCESKNLLPYPTEGRIWETYDFICDPDTVKLALRVLILWAQDENIIEKPGQNAKHLLYTKTFIELFMHIAQSAMYLTKKGQRAPTVNNNHFSAASLCLEFFRFCLTLRFYNKYEVKDLIPFPVYKYSALSKRAVVTYHTFAVTGRFRNIYLESKEVEDLIEMNPPIHIDSDIFLTVPIPPAEIKQAEEALMNCLQVEHVELREVRQTKKVIVSAKGSEQSLKALRSILRKKHTYLRELFRSGILPADI